MNVSGLILFATVIECGSLSKAAERMGLSRSAVSKQLTRFETELGARLIQRTTRKLSLTELGEQVWLEAQTVQNALHKVNSLTQNHQNNPHGVLRVSCSSSMGRIHLLPIVQHFCNAYPNIELQLQLEDRFVDLIAEQVDVCIRAGHLADSSLVAKRLGQLHWQLAASPEYLAARGTPQSPDDLSQHACLVYRNHASHINTWTFLDADLNEHHVKVKGPLTLNDGGALVEAARQHLGIAFTDRSYLGDDLSTSKLVALLPDYTPEAGFPVYAVYPARSWLPAKTTAFLKFLHEHFSPQIT